MNAHLEALAPRPRILHGFIAKAGPDLSNPHRGRGRARIPFACVSPDGRLPVTGIAVRTREATVRSE
jgi:hypothetical protein